MIQDIYKDDKDVYIIINNTEINIGDIDQIYKYEKEHNLKIDEELITFLDNEDKKSKFDKCGIKNILLDVKNLALNNNVEYFIHGKNLGEDDDTVCLSFILNKYSSNFECELRIFYSKKSIEVIKVELLFNKGTSGNCYGFILYRYFNYESYCLEVKQILEKYLRTNDYKEKDDLEIFEFMVKNITKNIF